MSDRSFPPLPAPWGLSAALSSLSRLSLCHYSNSLTAVFFVALFTVFFFSSSDVLLAKWLIESTIGEKKKESKDEEAKIIREKMKVLGELNTSKDIRKKKKNYCLLLYC